MTNIAHTYHQQNTAHAEQQRMLADTLAHFSCARAGGMNWYAFNEPNPEILNDPVRGGEHWTNFIDTAPDYYLISEDIEVIQKHAPALGKALPKKSMVVDLGPGEMTAVDGKTLPLIKNLQQPIGFKAVDVNSSFAHDAAQHVMSETGLSSDSIVGDFLNEPLHITSYHPAIFCLFGGLLCNAAKNTNISAFDQLTTSFKKLTRHMKPGDRLIMTQDSNQDEESLLRAYSHPDMAKYILSIMHKIKRDLPTENFDPYAFEFVPRWNPKEHLLSLNARVKRDYGVLAFKIADEPFTLGFGQEISLVNSYKFPVKRFIDAALEAGIVSEQLFKGTNIALHGFEYNPEKAA